MKKMMTFCLIAMLALGLMGFGFAKWSDSVTANVSVATGDVVFGIADMGTNDDGFGTGDNGADPNVAPGNNSEGKNVASAVSVNGTQIGSTGYYESITETITNAYPYYAPTSTFKIASLGSVPVKIESINIAWSGALAENVICQTWKVTYPNGTSTTGNTFDGLAAAVNKYQLHENQALTVDLQVYFNQQSEMNESATGTFTITASQWNEVAGTNPGQTAN